MPAMRTAGSAHAAARTDGSFPSQPSESGTARFAAYWAPSAVVITAHGELDAANADQLADYVQRSATYSRSLVLDLRGLEFFGIAGFSALHMINVRCVKADVHWALVPSPSVSRLLQICDPDGLLPTAESVDAALSSREEQRRLLQLVSQSR
jgi:anti-anti-sigma factor